MTRTDANLGVIRAIRGETLAQTALRIFWIAAALIGLEVIYDGWFIATELARLDNRRIPNVVTATAPIARLVLGFVGGLAWVGGAGRLNLRDPHQSTLFLLRLAGCAVLLAVTAWSRGSVAELLLLMAVVIYAGHYLREFAATVAPPRAWQALGMLVLSALMFWAVTKYGRVGNLYVYQLVRGERVQAADVVFQMRAR